MPTICPNPNLLHKDVPRGAAAFIRSSNESAKTSVSRKIVWLFYVAQVGLRTAQQLLLMGRREKGCMEKVKGKCKEGLGIVQLFRVEGWEGKGGISESRKALHPAGRKVWKREIKPEQGFLKHSQGLNTLHQLRAAAKSCPCWVCG